MDIMDVKRYNIDNQYINILLHPQNPIFSVQQHPRASNKKWMLLDIDFTF